MFKIKGISYVASTCDECVTHKYCTIHYKTHFVNSLHILIDLIKTYIKFNEWFKEKTPCLALMYFNFVFINFRVVEN